MPSLSTDEIHQKVEALALPLLAQAGVDLVELSVGRYKDDVIIRFTADLPAGGITIGQCSTLNHAIVGAIDADGFLGLQGYSLEFSSPGLDRPLVTARDFRRNLEGAVRLWLKEPVEGKTEHSGVLTAADEKQIVVRTKKNKEIVLPLGQIIKGQLIIT